MNPKGPGRAFCSGAGGGGGTWCMAALQGVLNPVSPLGVAGLGTVDTILDGRGFFDPCLSRAPAQRHLFGP